MCGAEHRTTADVGQGWLSQRREERRDVVGLWPSTVLGVLCALARVSGFPLGGPSSRGVGRRAGAWGYFDAASFSRIIAA